MISNNNKKKLEEIIIDEVVDQNNTLTDDMLVEAMENPEQTDSAIDRIIDYLQRHKCYRKLKKKDSK